MNNGVDTEQIVNDLKAVARDAEDLVKATAGEVSDKVREARTRVSAAVSSARQSCQHWEERAVVGAKATDKAIREHPYQSLGVAFMVGVVLGTLLGRK